MAKLIAGTYGQAMFELAVEMNQVDDMLDQVKTVKAVLKEEEDFVRFLNHPKISEEEKTALVERVLADRVSQEIIGLLVIIIKKGRQAQLITILDYFIDHVREYKNIGVVHVTSTAMLTSEQKNKIEKRLLETTKYVQLEMDYQVDPTLLGGVVIRIGDRVVDGSIKTKLATLTKSLQKIQLSEV